MADISEEYQLLLIKLFYLLFFFFFFFFCSICCFSKRAYSNESAKVRMAIRLDIK